jgi:hypothetical protein
MRGRLLYNEHLYTGPEGSTRVGAALLLWVWTAAQTGKNSKQDFLLAKCLVKQTQPVIEC